MKRLTLLALIWLVTLGLIQATLSPRAVRCEDEEKGEDLPNPAVAKFEGKTLNMNELIEGATIRGGVRLSGRGAERLRNMKGEELEEVVKDYFYNEKLAEEAMEKSYADDPKIKDQLEKTEQKILAGVIYEKEILDKVPEAAEEEVRQFYEDNKKDKFHQPFSFKMRHIYLSTYKTYVAKEGDSLPEIAEKVSGDKKLVEFILTNDEVKKARWVKPSERDEKPFRPVKAGEKLLVPISKKEKQTVLEKIKNIHQKLKEGVDFEALAKKDSQSGPNSGEVIGPIVPDKDKKSMLPKIIDAVKKTKVGEFSGVIETKHGYNIIKVEEKNEEKFVPFERVKRGLTARLTNERRDEHARTFLRQIAQSTKGVTINKNVFDAEDRTSDSVIVSLDDQIKFTLGDYDESIPQSRREETKDIDEKIELVLGSRKIVFPLLAKYGKSKGFHETPEFKKQFKHHKIKLLSNNYIREIIGDLEKPNEKELKEYYEQNKDRYTDPRKYDLSLLGLKIKDYGEVQKDEQREKRIEELKKQLKEVREKIKTKEDFEQKAEQISEDPTATRKGHVGMVPQRYRNGFDGRLEKMKTGEVSEPFVYGNFVYIMRVGEIEHEKLRPFEETERAVERDFISERNRRYVKEKKEKILKEGNFEFLLK